MEIISIKNFGVNCFLGEWVMVVHSLIERYVKSDHELLHQIK